MGVDLQEGKNQHASQCEVLGRCQQAVMQRDLWEDPEVANSQGEKWRGCWLSRLAWDCEEMR
jgi:hypothetical protein